MDWPQLFEEIFKGSFLQFEFFEKRAGATSAHVDDFLVASGSVPKFIGFGKYTHIIYIHFIDERFNEDFLGATFKNQ